MEYENVRKSVLSQELEMQTCVSKFGKNDMSWLKEVSLWLHILPRKKKKIRQKLKGSSLKEMRKRMSWQKQEQCWTKVFKRERERQEVYVAL